MSGSAGATDQENLGVCSECEQVEILTDSGICAFCSCGDSRAEEDIRELVEELAEEYDLPTVFWSLDNVYDEYDEKLQEGYWR